jgi:phosphonate transport system substrate-binding protein
VRPLRLLSYLSPSIPAGLFELLSRELGRRLELPVTIDFETRVSGPDPGSDPFASDRADVAFACAPSYPLLKRSGSPVVLLPAAPVFADPRAEGRPVYFSDVMVRAGHGARRFEELAGAVWSYNDRLSRSGWQRMLERLAEIGHAHGPETFFSGLVQSGSHLRSLELLAEGRADAAAIDSNTLWLARRREPSFSRKLRAIESWGPMPIQPVLLREGLEPELRDRLARALLDIHLEPGLARKMEQFGLRRFAPVDEASYATLPAGAAP